MQLRDQIWIQLLESPIPTPATTSQKVSSGDISGTKRGIIDPLASKRPEKFWIIKFKKEKESKKWTHFQKKSSSTNIYLGQLYQMQNGE